MNVTPELVSILVAVILGVGEAIRQYKKTGRFRLVSLPLRALKRLVYHLRSVFFTKPAKEDKQEPITLSPDTLRETLGTQSYELEWPLSYAYMGEDINARRYYYDPNRKYPHRQMHVRGFVEGNDVQVYAHEEPSGIQHPVAHLKSNDMTDTTTWVATNLDDLDPREWDA